MPRKPDELLYDTEAALRLVDTALHELQGGAAESVRGRLSRAGNAAPDTGGRDLRELLSSASVDVVALLDALRACRAILEANPEVLPISAASLHDDLDVAHGAHVGERVAAHGDDVGRQTDT